MVSLVLLYLTTIGTVSTLKHTFISTLQSWILCSTKFGFFIHQPLRLKTDNSVYYAPYVQQPGITHSVWYKSAPWLCQTMKALLMFCFQSPIFWMFIEGIYLHSRVSTHIFHQVPPFRIYYFIGWGIYFVNSGILTRNIFLNFCRPSSYRDVYLGRCNGTHN